MSNTEPSIAELKGEILPALFRSPATIGQYGAGMSGADSLNQLSNLMEGGAVTELAEKIGLIVAKLTDADPRRIAEKPTWFEKLLGREVERRVRYQVARKSLDQLMDEAEGVAKRVRDTLRALDGMLETHAGEVSRLQAYIQAGREFLDENSDAGAAKAGVIEFDKPRERFARKLANLATLLSSHEMSVTQMSLTRAQAVDMLDRFSETASVLVPVWRQHTLALITTKNMSPTMVAEASKAHQALMRSLTQSLEGISH
ncbi:protein KlaA [Xanthomonas vasicola]|uniref:toxic anion resistance protein n=1 Tax=Xanthomonas vasicola TaxID=56459 RepID=UPI0005318C9D|nr:toxic anion resistance protein [Xanthomonas vasicola]KGR62619.1 protein KlaA [Xanthomonas vasicola]